MAGQVRRQPAPRPPPGEQGPPATPDVAGRAEAVQQHQERLAAAALLYAQASPHSRSLPRAGPDATRTGTRHGLLAQPLRLARVGNSRNAGAKRAALATFAEGSGGDND